MDGRICMQSNHFMLFALIGAAIIGWALYQVSQQNQQISQFTSNKNNELDVINQNLDEMIDQRIKRNTPIQHIQPIQPIHPMISSNIFEQQPINYSDVTNTIHTEQQPINYLATTNAAQRQQDYQRMANPFIPPVQRGPFSPMLAEKAIQINTPTHGEYSNFQLVGYAYKPNNPDQMFQLFGRRIYSNKHEYYVVHPITLIKIPIKIKSDYELSNDDTIIIKGFPGDFRVEIYDLDRPRYVPY